jgi:hypothetical protein
MPWALIEPTIHPSKQAAETYASDRTATENVN